MHIVTVALEPPMQVVVGVNGVDRGGGGSLGFRG